MKITGGKKILFSGLAALCLCLALSFSAYAWFFFPLIKNTVIYTDGVVDVDVRAYAYNRAEQSFGGESDYMATSGDPAVIKLDYRNDLGETLEPYFFQWGGKYTSGDQYETIYKIVVTYGNEAEAYPALRLFGDFTFEFSCSGDEAGEEGIFNVRFMKLSYLLPDAGTPGEYLEAANYTELSEADYESGCRLELGDVVGDPTVGQKYSITFYLLLEVDLESLNDAAELIEGEFGMLDAEYSMGLSLFCRTIPANTLPSEETTAAP